MLLAVICSGFEVDWETVDGVGRAVWEGVCGAERACLHAFLRPLVLPEGSVGQGHCIPTAMSCTSADCSLQHMHLYMHMHMHTHSTLLLTCTTVPGLSMQKCCKPAPPLHPSTCTPTPPPTPASHQWPPGRARAGSRQRGVCSLVRRRLLPRESTGWDIGAVVGGEGGAGYPVSVRKGLEENPRPDYWLSCWAGKAGWWSTILLFVASRGKGWATSRQSVEPAGWGAGLLCG